MEYSGETCEGCVRFNNEGCLLVVDGRAYMHTDACERFKPTLECRKVRAMEKYKSGIMPPDDCECRAGPDSRCWSYGTVYCKECEYHPDAS